MRTNIKLLIILLSLVAATAVSASPTMSDCNKNFVAGAVSEASDAPVLYIPEASQITEFSNSRLAAIGAEILEPPPDFTDFSTVGAKTLPPVPPAFFMVLTGFLCVSLVKDRRVWLAALAGLLWAGQAGFQAIPQLASNISKHIQKKTTANIALLHQVEDLFRLRSDIEGTQCIGLLHHLAGIPAGTISSIRSPMSFLPHIPASWCGVNSVGDKLQQKRNTQTCSRAKLRRVGFSSPPNYPHHLGGASPTILNPAVICTTVRSEQYIYF